MALQPNNNSKKVFGAAAGWRNISIKRLLLFTAFVVVALVLSIYLVQNQYEKLDKQISSIYKDRLVPANYLFQMQTILLNKKLIQEHGGLQETGTLREIEGYDRKMDLIIRDYENTYLTEEETKEWKVLRTALQQYEEAENLLIHNNNSPSGIRIEIPFQEALASLARLNTYQADEGNRIQSSSKALLSGALMQSYVQLSLIIVLLAIGVAIIMAAPAKEDKRELYN